MPNSTIFGRPRRATLDGSEGLPLALDGGGNVHTLIDDIADYSKTIFDPLYLHASGANSIAAGGSLAVGGPLITFGGLYPAIQNIGTGASASIGCARFTASTSAVASVVVARSKGATVGDYTAVAPGDPLGNAPIWRGSDGTTLQNCAAISAEVDGTVSAGNVPGRIVFGAVGLGGGANISTMYKMSPATGISDGLGNVIIDQNRIVRLRSYTVATMPASAPAGAQIYISDESGGAVVAFGDGSAWRRVTDRAVVS